MSAEDFETMLKIWDLVKAERGGVHPDAQSVSGTHCRIHGSDQGYDFECGDGQ